MQKNNTMNRLTVIFNLLLVSVCFSQHSIADVLQKYNDHSIPYVYPEALFAQKDIFYLDAREKKEFDVSHIPKSVYVGFDHFDSTLFEAKTISKTSKIVVYCSLGVRSEKIAKKIRALGYANVSNLFGGIFLWKDKNGIIVDTDGIETQNVHAYSQSWGKYLNTGNKIYN